MPKKVSIGIVTADKTAKTRRVEIPRLARHAKYGKYTQQKTVCYVHDEENQSHEGDRVEIIEKNKSVNLAALREARSQAAESNTQTDE